MNSEELHKYIENPLLINHEVVSELKDLLEKFPHFQTAHLLYQRGLMNIESDQYDSQLKTTATYAGNRAILFSLLHKKIKTEAPKAITAELDVSTTASIIVAEKLIEEEIKEIQPEVSSSIKEATPSITNEVATPVVEDVDKEIINEETPSVTVSLNEITADLESIISKAEDSVAEVKSIEEATTEIKEPDTEQEIIAENIAPVEDNKDNNLLVNEIITEEEIHTKEVEIEETRGAITETVEVPTTIENDKSIPEEVVEEISTELAAVFEEEIPEELPIETIDEVKTVSEEIPEDIKLPPTISTEEVVLEPKSDKSLAEIILARIKEIEERDNLIKEKTESAPIITDSLVEHSTENAQTETIAEQIEDTLEEAVIEETSAIIEESNTDETPEEEEVVETTIVEEIQTQAPEEKIIPIKNSSDDLIDFEDTNKPAVVDSIEEDLLMFDFEDTQPSIEPKKEKNTAKKQRATDSYYELPTLDKHEYNPDNLIDAFLTKQPKLQPDLDKYKPSADLVDISKNSVEEGEILSDTLAKIYITQGNFKKALHIYEKLSLKYPEKNTYFANQISEVEKKLKS